MKVFITINNINFFNLSFLERLNILNRQFRPAFKKYFTCASIHNIFSNRSSYIRRDIIFFNIYYFGSAKSIKKIGIRRIAKSSQQHCYRKFPTTIYNNKKTIINISCKINPRPSSRNNPSLKKLCTIRVNRLIKKYTRRTLELRNNNSFRSIYYKSSFFCHIRNVTKINVLLYTLSIFVFIVFISNMKSKPNTKRSRISDSTIHAFITIILWLTKIIIFILQYIVSMRVFNWKNILKNTL